MEQIEEELKNDDENKKSPLQKSDSFDWPVSETIDYDNITDHDQGNDLPENCS